MTLTDSAQGWLRNDSSKWMFFEGGKPVTGTKTINGTRYTFNPKGETADKPKSLTYGSYTVKSGDTWRKIANAYKCNVNELAKANGKTIFSKINLGDVLKIPQ